MENNIHYRHIGIATWNKAGLLVRCICLFALLIQNLGYKPTPTLSWKEVPLAGTFQKDLSKTLRYSSLSKALWCSFLHKSLVHILAKLNEREILFKFVVVRLTVLTLYFLKNGIVIWENIFIFIVYLWTALHWCFVYNLNSKFLHNVLSHKVLQ